MPGDIEDAPDAVRITTAAAAPTSLRDGFRSDDTLDARPPPTFSLATAREGGDGGHGAAEGRAASDPAHAERVRAWASTARSRGIGGAPPADDILRGASSEASAPEGLHAMRVAPDELASATAEPAMGTRASMPIFSSREQLSETGSLHSNDRQANTLRRPREDEFGQAEDAREAKRQRIDERGTSIRNATDERNLIESELEHTHGLSRVDYLGFYDDMPTLNMLADIELFLLTQRQRWFDLGRVHSWNRFELELQRLRDSASSPSVAQDAQDELVCALRTLRDKNAYLSEKATALQADLTEVRADADRTSRLLHDAERQNYHLTQSEKRLERELEHVRHETRKRDAEADRFQRGEGESVPALKRTITNLIEDLVQERWSAEQVLRAHSTPLEYRTRGEWCEDFQSRARADLVQKHGAGSIVARWLETDPPDAHAARGPVRGPLVITVSALGSIESFDPDAPAYDQLDFIEKSVASDRTVAERRHEALRGLPPPSRTIPSHYIWTDEEHKLPVPLGKFGQPYWTGSSWEDFKPLRLWQDIHGGQVSRGDPFWIRLAQDAVRLPFEFRSNAQRILASEAHRFVPPGWAKAVLPQGEDVAEVDVWQQCVHNALYLPLAIRRQYSYVASTRTLYREWDAGDLGIYLILRACGPENVSKKEKKRLAEKQSSQPSRWSSWSDQVRRAVMWGDQNRTTWAAKSSPNAVAAATAAYSRPRRYAGTGDEEDVFSHLVRCGFNASRLVQQGDVYDYVQRAEQLEAKLQKYKTIVGEEDRTLTDHNTILARAKCRLELEDGRIPELRPLVRCKVKASDPVAAEHLKFLDTCTM